MNDVSWTEGTLNTLDLLLDSKNPRIDVRDNATQEEIRLQLLNHENIVELANDIIREKRLLPGDRIITCIENGRHVVLEGNRRVCACQMLLNPTLIPADLLKRFPKADSEELILNISQIKADVAPNRNAAENILTKRHTEPGIKKWTPIAKMRRVARWFNQGETINEIASRLGESKGSIRRKIQEYHLFQFALNLPGWTQDELKILQDQKLVVNPYLRFFTLARTKELLKLSFNEKEKPVTEHPEEKFNIMMRCVARAFFIPISVNGKPYANTRTPVDIIFNNCIELSEYEKQREEELAQIDQHDKETNDKNNKEQVTPELNNETKSDSGSGKETNTSHNDNNGDTKSGNSQKFPKPARFFENIDCPAQDQHLLMLTYEIKMINHIRMPISATMLLRSFLESALRYHLIRTNKWDKLIEKCGDEPGLKRIIGYCINKDNNVFRIKRARDVLTVFSGTGFKDVFDLVVHGTWIMANSQILEQAAAILRPLIIYIINDERWGEKNVSV